MSLPYEKMCSTKGSGSKNHYVKGTDLNNKQKNTRTLGNLLKIQRFER